MWDYGDWFARTTRMDTGEDIRILCSTMHQASKLPEMRITQSNGDVGPPTQFPTLVIQDIAPRNGTPVMQANAMMTLRIGDWHSGDHLIFGRVDDAGIRSSVALIDHPDSQAALQALHRGTSADILSAGRVVATISLTGFSAAYTKAMGECGFTGAGVTE